MIPVDKGRGPGLPLFVLQAVQLLLLLAVAQAFLIEQTYGLTKLLPVVFAGFVIHAWLPAAWRGPFFVLLFPTSAIALLGLLPAAVLIVLGVSLFIICHLPASLRMRAGILVAFGSALAAIRTGAIETPDAVLQNYLQSQTLPILAAIFMFRTIIYMYDLQHEKKTVSIWQRLSYFFLFPNVCFPLFPVIDYQTFKRTHYDRAPAEIYQKGLDWILRGITHLLLYRIVYHYLVPNPLEIHDLAGVVQYALTSFLLYLRVSGLFHLIIGMLCLFGYNLPETHHRYYLSESFTDFWRRINIYWKDFMVKIFYFPLFVALRRWGVTTAMIAATLITFFITWLLHSYQWFWLRGTFPLHPQDIIFWGVLALLVTANSLWEEKYGRKRRSLKKGERPPLGEALGRSVRTVAIFVVICLLWSFWTSSSIDEWLAVMAIATAATPLEITVAVLVVSSITAVGVLVQLFGGREPVKTGPPHANVPFRALRLGTAALLLLAVSSPVVNNQFDPRVGSLVATITGDQLNTRDQQQLVKGYYEELLGAESSGSMAWSVRAEEPDTWRWDGAHEHGHRTYTDDMRYALLQPNIDTFDKHAPFATNQWGMRDRHYDKEKSPNTYRIAVLGSSYTLGSGVEMASTFPSLLEQRLNSDEFNSRYDRIEVLNFAQAGYSILRRQAIFEKNALDFDVDLVIDMSMTREEYLAVRNLRAAVEDEIVHLDPVLLDILRRAKVTPDMSSEAIENRLGRFTNEILLWGYRQLASTAAQNDVEAVVFLLPTTSITTAAYDQEWASLSSVFEIAGLTVINVAGVYGPVEDRDSLKLAPWDSHPNAEGHAVLADRIFRELVNLQYLRANDAGDDAVIGSH